MIVDEVDLPLLHVRLPTGFLVPIDQYDMEKGLPQASVKDVVWKKEIEQVRKGYEKKRKHDDWLRVRHPEEFEKKQHFEKRRVFQYEIGRGLSHVKVLKYTKDLPSLLKKEEQAGMLRKAKREEDNVTAKNAEKSYKMVKHVIHLL